MEFACRTLKYSDQGLVVWTELASFVHKHQGLNILQLEKQTRLINSLLYATIMPTENLPKIFGLYRDFPKVFRRTCFAGI